MTAPEAACLRGRRVMVTGATGFIGRELLRRIGDAPSAVGWLARDPAPEGGGVRLAVDLRNPGDIAAAVDGFRPEVVFHLGAAVGYEVEEDEAFALNLRATEALYRAAARAGCERLIVASTALVLGLEDLVDADEDLPLAEADPLPYIASKVRMEAMLASCARERSGPPAFVLRFPRVYGDADQRILPPLIQRLHDGTLQLIEGGTKLQSFLHVTDAARACLQAAGADAAAARTYHIAAGDRVTNKQIFDLIADAAGAPRATRSMPLDKALAFAQWNERKAGRPDPAGRVAFGVRFTGCHHHYSIARARASLGYEPGVAIESGLPRAVAAICAGQALRRGAP